MTRLLILAALLAVLTISSSDPDPATDQPTAGSLVAAAPVNEPVNTSPVPISDKKREPKEASCDQPVVRETRKLTPAEIEGFVQEAVSNAKAVRKIALEKEVSAGSLTREEANQQVADFELNDIPSIEQAARGAAPVEQSWEAVFTDSPELLGDPPKPEDDPDGSEYEKWVEKAKEVGCKTTPFRGSGKLAAPPLTTTYTVGTWSCTHSTSTSNSVGQTVAKVRQTSSWYSNSQGLPSSPRKSYSTSASWGWDEKGSVQGDGPDVTVKWGVPLQYYSWTGQNFHFKYFGIELYTWYGEVEQWFGYSGKWGPYCSRFWWYP